MALPATAVLASSLVQAHAETNLESAADERHESSATWDLTSDIDRGVPTSSERNIFSCGRLVGISALHSEPGSDAQTDDDGESIQAWVGELSLHVLANTLTECRHSDTSYPRALVIQFLDSRPISREALYNSLQQRLPAHSAKAIEDIISKVQIYQTFELEEILEAVTRISDTLYSIQQKQSHSKSSTGESEASHQTATPSLSEDPTRKKPMTKGNGPVVLILEGLDRSLEDLARTANPLAGQARLMSLLRTLTVLSRTYASFLTVMVVNAIPLPSTPDVPDQQQYQQGERDYEASPVQDELRSTAQQSHPLIPVHSVFAQAPSPSNPRTRASASFSRPTTPYPSIFARSLDQGFDLHLLVSRVQRRMVIEVAKDRVSDNLGRWCAI